LQVAQVVEEPEQVLQELEQEVGEQIPLPGGFIERSGLLHVDPQDVVVSKGAELAEHKLE